MLLRELVAHPVLRLRLLHGGRDPEATLDRAVRWVYTTDLIDPARYLSGGELVITGLVWRQDAADSERFVAAVARCGAAALAAGEAVFHAIPEDVVEACRRHDLPLIAVPEEVSFATVTELVVGSIAAARGDRLALTLGRQRQLLSAMAGGSGLDELVTQVSAVIGRTCRVFSTTGRAVAAGPEARGPGALSDGELDRLVAAYLTAERLPVTVPGDPARSVFPVGPAAGWTSEQRLTSWFVAVDGDHAGWDVEASDLVGELVAIAALDRARRNEGLRVVRGVAEDAIALIAAGSGNRPDTAVRLKQAGMDPAGPFILAVAGFVDRPDRVETARAVLVDAAAQLGPPAEAVHAGLAVALLPAPADGAGRADVLLRAALGRLAPGLRDARLAVGVSRPSEPDALSGALLEARHARELAQLRPGPLHVVSGAELTSHVALLAAVPDEARRAFAGRVLEPVLAYDARTGAGLLKTLEAFLDCSGSWSRTAERLHVHVNTVRYRIGRVEELTGRDLGGFPDRVDVFLALRSR